MCGRYVSPDTAAIERQWRIIRRSGDPFPTRFNVSPSMPVPILWREDDSLALGAARWGFIPNWWKEAKPPRFSHNARVEEAASKPMWRDAMREESGGARCLVPAQGWYEWREKDRQPFYFHRGDGRLFAFAGLMSTREGVLTCAILTGASRGSLAPIHERMPLALAPAGEEAWLRAGALELAEGIAHGIAHYAVPTLVNNSRAEGPALIEPLAA